MEALKLVNSKKIYGVYLGKGDELLPPHTQNLNIAALAG
jgi:hypothetical protein